MKFTIGDVRHLITETLTESQAKAIEAYLNDGTIPKADPCMGCEPNLIRKYIARIQAAESRGEWPPARTVLEGTDVGPSDPEGYTAGTHPGSGKPKAAAKKAK